MLWCRPMAAIRSWLRVLMRCSCRWGWWVLLAIGGRRGILRLMAPVRRLGWRCVLIFLRSCSRQTTPYPRVIDIVASYSRYSCEVGLCP
ncbi:hypothetical protein F5Y14DRAFT_349860 [Nemania sp. NC0429]|nr:hypothetical protein F5Y14DRAFT_349860 [Nemania sp. NC0429]